MRKGMSRGRVIAALFCAAIALDGGAIGAARATPVDWQALGNEATAILQRYIRIDTTNPPGNEMAAAKFLAELFTAAGIEARAFESEAGRGNVMARLPGDGSQRPIVLLNHLDVVGANPADWQHPPFAAEIADGYLYGRGAIDCKGVGVVQAMAMLALKRSGRTLPRDVIFLGTAGEETGGQAGAGWLVAHHFEWLGDAEYVLNEGGGLRLEADGSAVYEVGTTEKAPLWVKLTAHGEPGHGSVPRGVSSVQRLVRALERVRTREPEIRVVPEVQAYYAALAELVDEPLQTSYRDLRAALAEPAFRARFLAAPADAALVQSTISPTVLHGSDKTNVVPPIATAELDIRLLPDERPEEFLRKLEAVIDDDQVAIDVLLNFPPASSPADTDLFRAIATVARGEGAGVVPNVLRGFTDSHFFRERGVTAYGFVPVALSDEDERRMHGLDERIPLASLSAAPRRMVAILEALAELDRGKR